MTMLPSPADGLPDGAAGIIRANAAEGERLRRLHPDVLALCYREQWFRLLVPQRWGGGAISLPRLVRLEEGLAYADGAVGWTVTLCSGAGWFAGFFPEGPFDGLFSDGRLCIAGSGSPTGDAHVVAGGFRVSGRWAYASGIRHATAYTANCVIWKDGAPSMGPDGERVVRPFLFLPGEVQIHDDWNAVGLIATGSHGFSVEGLMVAADRCFVIDATSATDDNALYRYPFLPLAEATLAVNLSGMAQHFLECCGEVFRRRVNAQTERLLTRARADLAAVRGDFYRVLDNSWDGKPSPEVFAKVGRVAHDLAAAAREWVDRLYPYAGLGAARVDTEINRVWRDLHTAGQHPLLVFSPEG